MTKENENQSLNLKENILKETIYPCLQEIFSKKAQKVAAIDVRGLTSYTDAIIVVTATSRRQAAAIAEHLYINMKNTGNMPLGVEGIKDGNWALLDFGDLIVHVFSREARDFYDIEGLWSDAPRLDLSEFESIDD